MSPLRRPLQCTLLLCTGVVVKLVEGQVEETNQQPIKSCSLSGKMVCASFRLKQLEHARPQVTAIDTRLFWTNAAPKYMSHFGACHD